MLTRRLLCLLESSFNLSSSALIYSSLVPSYVLYSSRLALTVFLEEHNLLTRWVAWPHGLGFVHLW